MFSRSSVNHIYRTVWNDALGAMVAVPEHASSHPGAGGAPSFGPIRIESVLDAVSSFGSLALAIALIWGGASSAYANPIGGVAVQGQATIVNSGNQLTVTTQNGVGTNHSAINWQSFSIPLGSSTRIEQPNAASMSINRVVTNTPSALFGTLSSNGKVVLVNQAGIAVGAGAQVDTAGFTASAVGMADQDALSGRLRFGGVGLTDTTGALTVQGNIIARGGDVVLIAPSIELAKSAVVEAQGGSVMLAAGRSVEVTGRGLEGISMQVQAPADQAINLGTLKGDAVAIFAGTLKHSGVIQATQASMDGGKVVLKAAGDAYVEGAGAITATSATGKGGSVSVLGNRVAVIDRAQIDASGATGGGTVLVGGDYQGKNPDVQNAFMTHVGQDASLKADATANGNGGKVIVWSDDTTRAYGRISARGGAKGGNGGFVETSGKRYLDVANAYPDVRAPQGKAGSWLLDPEDVTITSSTANITAAPLFQPVAANTTTNLDAATLSAYLVSFGDVTVDTTGQNNSGTATQGSILVDAPIIPILTSPRTLTLKAHNDIIVTFAGSIAATGNKLNVVFTADQDVSSAGAVSIDTSSVGVKTNGGDFTAKGVGITINAPIDVGTGTVSLTRTGSGSLVQSGTGFPGVITASQLEVIGGVTDPISLLSANAIGTLAVKANGAFTFNNSGSSALTIGTVATSVGVNASSSGDVTITHSGGGALTVSQPIFAANVALTSSGGISVGNNVTASGTLGLTTTNTNINQTAGAIVVTNASTVSAGSGDILLQSTGTNDFSNISLSGGSVQVKDTNAMNVTSLTSGVNKKVVLVANGALTLPLTAIDTGTNDLEIGSGTLLKTEADLSGTNIKLVSPAGVDVEFNVTATGTLNMDATSGSVMLNNSTGIGVITVTGATTVNAGAGNVELAPGLGSADFSSIAATASGSVAIKDVNALVLNGVSGTGVTITTGGALSQAAGVISTSGTLNTTTVGGTTLTNTNSVASLIAINTGSGSFSFKNSGALSVSVNNGAGTGAVNVQTTGNLTLLNTGVISDATGDAAVLVAGGNFLNPSNYNISLTNGGAKRWLIYSTNPSSNTVGALLEGGTSFQQYGATYPATTVLGGTSENGLLYSLASSTATAAVSLIGSVSKVFDGTTTALLSASNYSIGVGTDALFGNSTAATFASAGTGAYSTPNVGSGITVTSSGGTATLTFPSSKTVYGFTLGASSGAIGSITPAPIVITPVSASLIGSVSKVYDGNLVATLTPGNFQLSGFAGSDSALVTQTAGTYASKDVGSAIAVSASLAASNFNPVGSTQLSNYSLPTIAKGNIGIITPKPLTLAPSAANKVYDGTVAATVTDYGLAGFVAGELVKASSTSAAFDNKDVGTAKKVSISGITLADDTGLASNYSVLADAEAFADVTAVTPAVIPVVIPVNGPTISPSADAVTPDYLAMFVENFRSAMQGPQVNFTVPIAANSGGGGSGEMGVNAKDKDKLRGKDNIVLEGETCKP